MMEPVLDVGKVSETVEVEASAAAQSKLNRPT